MTKVDIKREAVGMSFEEVFGIVNRYMVGTDALAAIGARLALAESGQAADPAVVDALDRVVAAAGIAGLDGLAPPQVAMLASSIRSFFRQSADVLNEPGRDPGWRYTDPLILEGQGRASMMVVQLLNTHVPEVKATTSFLDVGVGVGWLAVAATQAWPGCTVVGIDTWAPSLERARTNVDAAGVADRVTVRDQDITDLDDVDAFDTAWVPSFFFTRDELAAGLAAVARSLKPGGWVVVGRYAPPPDPVVEATMRLRAVRDGGCMLDADECVELLTAAGCADVHEVPQAWRGAMGFVIGRKPS